MPALYIDSGLPRTDVQYHSICIDSMHVLMYIDLIIMAPARTQVQPLLYPRKLLIKCSHRYSTRGISMATLQLSTHTYTVRLP